DPSCVDGRRVAFPGMAPAPRPEHVDIGPLRWTVSFEQAPLVTAARDDDQAPSFGLMLPEQLTILVDGERPEQVVRDTFVHEMLHAVIYTYSVECKPADGDREPGHSDDIEEDLVSDL